MKKLICTSILAILIASVTTVMAQDYPEEYLGLPGDNLNLYAVMKIFQESETLEAFERSLNAEDSHVNNLDLNGDNMVDYITVSDYVDGNVHNIVLRAVLNAKEYQDVAVFTVQKFSNGSVQIQLIGDEELYGKNYIIEPIYAETPNPGYTGRTVYSTNSKVVTTTYYEVAAWPVITFIYNPYYIRWRSSWYWGYYPVYWRPWRPFYWHYYYGYQSHWYPDYYAHYRHWNHPRYDRYNDFYYRGVRASSPNVAHRINDGGYRQTYSRPETRKYGEALYANTHDTRNNPSGTPGAGSTRRDSPSVTNRSSGQGSDSHRNSNQVQGRNGNTTSPGQNNGAANRSSGSANRNASTSGSGRSSSGTPAGQTQRTSNTVRNSQPSSQSSQPATRSSQSSTQRTQTTTRSSQSSTQRTQTSTRSSQPSSQKTQTSTRSSQASSGRSSATKASRPSTSGKSSSSASRKTSNTSSKSSSPSKSKSSSKESDKKSSSRR